MVTKKVWVTPELVDLAAIADAENKPGSGADGGKKDNKS